MEDFDIDIDSPEMANVPADLTEGELDEVLAYVNERRSYGLYRGLDRGHFYQLTADSIVLDHRPDFGLRMRHGSESFFNRLRETGTEDHAGTEVLVESLGHLAMYILYGWETGIYNEFRHLQGRGLTKEQIVELVLHAQLSAGIRGLKLVYNALGKHLIDWRDGPRPYQRLEGAVPWPEGWTADPPAFKAGLDRSVRPLTARDRDNVEHWYDENVGFLPGAVSFAISHHPEFYKWQRIKWECIFQTLPKQVLPYIMVRQHMLTGFEEGLREAVLLGKNWGIAKEWMTHAFVVSAYYTGFDGLGPVNDAVGDIMNDWAE